MSLVSAWWLMGVSSLLRLDFLSVVYTYVMNEVILVTIQLEEQ